MHSPILITKSDGTKEPFDESKLINSLRRSGASPLSIEHITDQVGREMMEGMSTADIYTRAFALLRKHSQPIAVKYSIRRALFELGPEGFPFERFVARIFQLWGYETVTDQIVMGDCVPHEVDVVAWKGDELDMVEAKFHHELGLRSDLKIALYVHARFEDLKDNAFDYGGKQRRLSSKGRWLITNTKFTDAAIKYGECKNLNLVGWNYPVKGNLHQVIEQNGLHPVTCISALAGQDKKNLISQGVLTCRDVIAKPEMLTKIGLKPAQSEKALTEAKFIVEHAK